MSKLIVKIGDIVEGQFGEGPIVAMTEKICVYENTNAEEGEVGAHIGEEWDWIKAKVTGTGERLYPIAEKEL